MVCFTHHRSSRLNLMKNRVASRFKMAPLKINWTSSTWFNQFKNNFFGRRWVGSFVSFSKSALDQLDPILERSLKFQSNQMSQIQWNFALVRAALWRTGDEVIECISLLGCSFHRVKHHLCCHLKRNIFKKWEWHTFTFCCLVTVDQRGEIRQLRVVCRPFVPAGQRI